MNQTSEQQEREAFEAWFEQERTRTWFAAGCDKDRGPIPSEFWAMGIKADWWTGWQARSALAANSGPMPTNADQAAAMALLGEAWLQENAPERLRAATPAPAPAQAQQAHWTPEQVLRTQEIAAELKAKIKHKPLTEQEVAEAVFDYYQHFSDPQAAAEAHFDKDLAMFRLAERACAEAWGVKLAGIGASTGGKP